MLRVEGNERTGMGKSGAGKPEREVYYRLHELRTEKSALNPCNLWHSLLKLRSKMEFDVFEFTLGHVENKLRIGHKYIAASLIGGHLLVLPVPEFG